jgi:hypothetical protein
MVEVFIVYANTMFDGGDAVRVFADKGEAEAFARKCQAHNESEPHAPAPDAPESEWDAWHVRYKEWADANPSGYTQRDYVVGPLPFVPSTAKERA